MQANERYLNHERHAASTTHCKNDTDKTNGKLQCENEASKWRCKYLLSTDNSLSYHISCEYCVLAVIIVSKSMEQIILVIEFW